MTLRALRLFSAIVLAVAIHMTSPAAEAVGEMCIPDFCVVTTELWCQYNCENQCEMGYIYTPNDPACDYAEAPGPNSCVCEGPAGGFPSVGAGSGSGR